MVDEIFDRGYQVSRNQLNAAIGRAVGRFGRAITNAFEVLVRIEYQSPWLSKRRQVRCN